MRSRVWSAAAGAWLVTALSVSAQEAKPSPKPRPRPDPLAAAADKTKRLSEPGSQHKLLELFLGKWATETRFYFFTTPTQPEKGTAEGAWLMKDRWLKLAWSGPYMGTPSEGFMLIGYDNLRQNYVTTSVTSLDTMMARSAGDPNEKGDALLLYGTVDEYQTSEPDRLMKQVWRFVTPDKLALEVYDMALGDTGQKFVEVTFIRQP